MEPQYNSSSPSIHPYPAVITKSTNRLIFQFCIVGLIILLNSLILISIIANRNRFWSSYFYCLLSAIVSSILFAIIAMPISILFRDSQKIILNSVLPCKTWHAVSHLLWDASVFSVIYLNLDLIMSLMRPNIYLQKSYELFMKVVLISSWTCSLVINIWLVCISSLRTGSLNPVQPCLHVANREHLQVSLICGLLLLLLTFALCFVLVSDAAPPSLRLDNKLTCCVLPLLLLDGFVNIVRVVPEAFSLVLAFKPGIFSNPFDEKLVSEELEFISWTSLWLLPVFWMLDTTMRKIVKMAFTCRTRSREHEDIHSSSSEEESL